jgi:hypothetical protein
MWHLEGTPWKGPRSCSSTKSNADAACAPSLPRWPIFQSLVALNVLHSTRSTVLCISATAVMLEIKVSMWSSQKNCGRTTTLKSSPSTAGPSNGCYDWSASGGMNSATRMDAEAMEASGGVCFGGISMERFGMTLLVPLAQQSPCKRSRRRKGLLGLCR